MSKTYTTVKQIARELGIDAGKVLSWIHRGELKAINIATNSRGRPRWRIPAEAWVYWFSGTLSFDVLELVSKKTKDLRLFFL